MIFLKAWNASRGCLFTEVLTVSSSLVMDSVVSGEEGLGLLLENLG